MSVERLLSTLLYEGYALYPYTPGATKNATPTPFGIVYPPAYAAGGPHTFDRARMQLVLEPGERSVGHAGVPRGERRATGRARGRGDRSSSPSARCRARPPAPRRRWRAGWSGWRCACTTRHRSPRDWTAPARCARRCARRTSSCARRAAASPRRSRPARPPRRGGRVRPHQHLPRARDRHRRRRCWARRSCSRTIRRSRPRATATCSTRPRSRRRCCCTCSRSATREREQIATQDPKVREMLARADAEGPEALKRLHGRVTVTDLPPAHRPGPADVAGEPAISVDGVTYRRGAKVRLRPGLRRCAAGRRLGRPHGDDRADLPRLRGRRPPRRSPSTTIPARS